MSERIWYAGAWRSPESIEKKKAADRARAKKRWEDPEYRKKKAAAKRKAHEANPELQRERNRKYYNDNKEVENAKRVEWSRQNRERQRAYSRELYSRDREENARKERERRDKRNPDRVIRRSCKELTDGGISIDEFAERVSAAVEQADENCGI